MAGTYEGTDMTPKDAITNSARMVLDLPADAYHAHPAISRSALATVAKTPKHYWYKYLSGQYEAEKTNALRFGGGFHTLTLENHKFNEVCAVVPEDAPKRPSVTQVNAKKPSDDTLAQIAWWEEFDEKNKNKTIIKAGELTEMKLMSAAVLNEPASKKVINASGKIEATFFWHDENYGVDLKCRPDYYRDDGIVLDLKTCADASEYAFERSVADYFYDVQAYMCIEGIRNVTGKEPTDFIFVCVEKKPPYCVAFYVATDELIECGRLRYHRLMEIYSACKKKNDWPGYGHFIRPIGVPQWLAKKVEKNNV
jgi:hypothetical protein